MSVQRKGDREEGQTGLSSDFLVIIFIGITLCFGRIVPVAINISMILSVNPSRTIGHQCIADSDATEQATRQRHQ